VAQRVFWIPSTAVEAAFAHVFPRREDGDDLAGVFNLSPGEGSTYRQVRMTDERAASLRADAAACLDELELGDDREALERLVRALEPRVT
jgi:hypothetical protein